MMNVNWGKLITGVLLSFIPLFCFVFIVYSSRAYLSSENLKEDYFLGSISPSIKEDYNSEEDNKVYLIPATIDATAAVSIESNFSDALEKNIFEKNRDLKLPIASLTKLMTAVVAIENYDLSQKITISKEADSQLPMQTDFKLEDTFPIEKILYVMLIESSNKAAFALSEKMGQEKFISLMNQKAKDIGMQNTFFADPTGLSSGNISTANDLVVLIKYILKKYPKIAEISTIKEYELENFGKIENTNQLLVEFPEIVFGKTGFTNDANGCLLLVLKNPKNNNYLINIILGADDRFSEMRKLINWENIIHNINGN